MEALNSPGTYLRPLEVLVQPGKQWEKQLAWWIPKPRPKSPPGWGESQVKKRRTDRPQTDDTFSNTEPPE